MRINDVLAQGVSLGPLALVPSSHAQDGTPQVVGGKAFFANSAPDTDFMVAPTSTGAETFWVLRSQFSPGEESLNLRLPPGWRLVAAKGSAGAVIVDRAGKIQVAISAPTATDAAGRPVPVSYQFAGDAIRVHVADQGKDVTFPVEVDPRFSFGGYGPYVGPGNFSGWHYESTSSFPLTASDPASTPESVSTQPGFPYVSNTAGQWVFKAPGSSFISEMDVGGLTHNTAGNSYLVFGIYNADWSAAGGGFYPDGRQPPAGSQPFVTPNAFNNVMRVCTTSDYNPNSLCPAQGNVGNRAMLALLLSGNGPYPTTESVSAGGIEMMLGDNAAPTTPTTNIPTSGTVDRVRVTSTQGGLGLSDISVSFPTGGTGPGTSMLDYPITCENGATPFAYCPLSETVTFGTGLSNGSYPLTITATAAGGATAIRTQTVDFQAGSGTPNTTGHANQVLSPAETRGGGSPTELPCQRCAGDPGNTASGDYYETAPDLSLPGRGPGLTMSRTYSSLAAEGGASSAFGHGWAFNYGMSLTVDSGSGNVTITNPNGSQTVFEPDGTGGYAAPARVLATLAHHSDGTYTYTVRARSIYTFDAAGHLTALSDLNGNTTTLAYDGSGRLTTATDGAGRTLAFTYSTDGEISSVADQTGRSVAYAYNSAGDLTDVTDVRGGHWDYRIAGINRRGERNERVRH